MKWVVDASVAAKWLAPEAESAQAEALLDGELLAPDLIFPEVANILWKKQSRGEMDAATAHAAMRWLAQVPLHVVESVTLMTDALALSMRLQHPAYDCFYLALARQAGCLLVTADKRLVERCQRADVMDLNEMVVSLVATDLPP
jgi:predicted nucleic acid-binding protein